MTTISHKVHCLNRMATLVWKQCTGRTSEAMMVEIIHKELGVDADETVIQLTLEKLAGADLLKTEERTWFANPTSRRQAAKTLAKFGIVAAAALVATIVAPASAQAASPVSCKNNQGCASNNCCKSPGGQSGHPGCGTCQPTGTSCPSGNC